MAEESTFIDPPSPSEVIPLINMAPEPFIEATDSIGCKSSLLRMFRVSSAYNNDRVSRGFLDCFNSSVATVFSRQMVMGQGHGQIKT